MSTGIEQDLDLAKQAARDAGAVIMRYFGSRMEVRHKDPDQPVTDADVEADTLLREQLLRDRPGYGWLSEETTDDPDRLQRSRVWIVDPIDGTRSFVSGRPEFSVSVGLAVDGEAVAGVVYNPARDELFHAIRGAGAWVDAGGRTERLRVGGRTAADELTVVASRSDIAGGEFDTLGGAWRLEGVGSTAYKMALVAWGRGDIFLSRGPKQEWDVCAGLLLVLEAGGTASDVLGNVPRFNRRSTDLRGTIAANRVLHEEALTRVRLQDWANGAGKTRKAG